MGRLVDRVDALIGECTAAGVIFRLREGKLNPLLTKGLPPSSLLARVKADREAIGIRLSEMFHALDGEGFGENQPGDGQTQTGGESC